MRAERLMGWAWPGLGLTGSLAISAAGPSLFGAAWWFHLPLGHTASELLFYSGIALLCAAWLGLGRSLWRTKTARLPAGQMPAGDTNTRRLVLIGAAWALPLALAPPLFSHDVYSYLAQGEILHLGLNPYQVSPHVLAAAGQTHLLAGVSPFWRHTTCPYGPLFIGLASLVAGIVGSHVIAGVMLLKLLELAGFALLAVFVPRLARALGSDPARATWLALISPLVLLQLVAAGHNDALMAGLLVAGVTLAVERRWLLGIAVCAVAAAVKLPAAAAIVFIAVAWARAQGGQIATARAAALAVAVPAGVLGAVSVATGLGTSWLTGGALSTPGRVHLAVTPSTALGWTVTSLLHLVGIHASMHQIAGVFGTVALAGCAALGLWLLNRTRHANLVTGLAVLLLASVFTGPATWPWYLTWGIALLACSSTAQRSRWLPPALVLSALLVYADGQFAVALQMAPWMLALYVAAGAAALWRLRDRARPAAEGWHRITAEQPALTNS